MECPFCNIPKETRTVKEGKTAFVILSNPRAEKFKNPLYKDLSEEEKNKIIGLLK